MTLVSGNQKFPPINLEPKPGTQAQSMPPLLPVIKRRFLPALLTLVSAVAGAIVYLKITPSVYQAHMRLILEDTQISVSELGHNLSQLSAGVPGDSSPLATQAELIKSKQVLQKAVEQVLPPNADLEQQQALVGSLEQGLKVKIVPATNILELSYQQQDPKMATELLNAVAEAIVVTSTEEIRAEAKSVREFLEAELPQQRAVLEAAASAENQYRQASGLVSLEEQTGSLVTSLAQLEAQERELTAQLQEAQARVRSLEQVTGLRNVQSAYTGGRIGQDRELSDLRAQAANLDSELATMRSRLTDSHPQIQSLLEERQAIRSLYQQKLSRVDGNGQSIRGSQIATDELSQDFTSQFIAAKTQQEGLRERLQAVTINRLQLQKRLDNLPKKQKALTDLVRQREEADSSLKFLTGKLEEARIAEAQLFSNIRIVELAQQPSSPSAPNPKLIMVVATVAGLGLAAAMMLMLESLDNRLHDGLELEHKLHLPLLGVLPNLPPNALSLQSPEYFLDNLSLLEPYRLFLKTLEFHNQGKQQLIVVSSTISGEGKSVVASHLGAAAAMLSRRTLIIDADLRRPKQHNFWGLIPQPGLKDVLDRELSLLVQPTALENLSVMTCGGSHTRPSQILESDALRHLLREAAAHYDLVIVDTAPVSSCADAHTIGRYSDALVMITRPQVTLKDSLYRSISALKNNGLPLLGFVVNGMTSDTEKFYRYAFDGYQPLQPQWNEPNTVEGKIQPLNSFGRGSEQDD